MSRNKNYSNYFQKKENRKHESIELEDEDILEIVEGTTKSEDTDKDGFEELVVEVEKGMDYIPKNVEVKHHRIGKIVDCKLLNVRSKPSKDSEVLTILPVDSIVTILDDMSFKDFYKVIIGDIEGYCMKKFIKIT